VGRWTQGGDSVRKGAMDEKGKLLGYQKREGGDELSSLPETESLKIDERGDWGRSGRR